MARPRLKQPYEVIAIHRPRTVRITTNPTDGDDQKVIREDDGSILFGPKTVFATSDRAATLIAYAEIIKVPENGNLEPDDIDFRVRLFQGDSNPPSTNCCNSPAERW